MQVAAFTARHQGFGDQGNKTPEEAQVNVRRLVYWRTRTRPQPIMTRPGINEGQGTFL